MTMHADEAVIYTDGGCIGNPGIGAWACVVILGDKTIRRSGSKAQTTNNQMELQAVIEALHCVQELGAERAIIHSDSEYVVKGVSKWMPQWKQKNWKRANKKAVLNVELWKAIDALLPVLSIRWKWVPGHANVALNEVCHDLVHEAIEHHNA